MMLTKDMAGTVAIHFIGIGGAGMSGLATVMSDLGFTVTGSDLVESKATVRLRKSRVLITLGHRPILLEKNSVVVYSSAVSDDNVELESARQQAALVVRRGEFLAKIASFYPLTVSIAGSHGKTTVTAMLVHILTTCGCRPGYIIGGDTIDQAPAAVGDGEVFITEVDESDATQSLMKSSLGVITNIDDDHCWSLGGIDNLHKSFVQFAEQSKRLLTYQTETTLQLFRHVTSVRFLSDDDVSQHLFLPVPGRHNLFNAKLAVEAAAFLGIDKNQSCKALSSFPGVDRRFSIRLRNELCTVVEDYAHHPTELEATLDTLRDEFPDRRLMIVFQPHRFERVIRYRDRFADILGRADAVIVVPPFHAWSTGLEMVDATAIVDRLSHIRAVYSSGNFHQLAIEVTDWISTGDVVAVIGAGDITGFVPALIDAITRKGMDN